jgi:uncharacterized protein YeaO (DUF488 family)
MGFGYRLYGFEPRGISKEEAKIQLWVKEIGPRLVCSWAQIINR